MGSELAVSLVGESKDEADETFTRMYALVQEYDESFSRFKSKSELSRLNAARAMKVSPRMLEILGLGQELYAATDGAFNPLVDVSRFGYDEDIESVLHQERVRVHTGEYNTNVSSMVLDVPESRVELKEGQTFDVGGYLKGYVAERMAGFAQRMPGVIVNVGGDLFTYGLDAEDKPFVFSIDNPVPGTESLRFSYTDGAVATSGTYRRQWLLEGRSFFHILAADGNGNPETDLVSATVLAPLGHEAEGYATAAIVLGSQAGGRLLAAKNLDYCFIRIDGSYLMSPGFRMRIED